MRFFRLWMIVLLVGLATPHSAQAQQANSCKQCSDQRHACGRLFREDLPGRVRAVYEKLPAQIAGQSKLQPLPWPKWR
jgi:hypothetical protein